MAQMIMQIFSRQLSLSTQVLLALFLGVLVGIFFGERVAWLNIVGIVFVKFLQIAVIPYIVLSLVVGLGSLSPQQTKEVAKKFGLLILLFWFMGLLVVFSLALSFPEWKGASFFSASLITPPPELNYYDLYIPSNPFKSLSESAVPAVVVFSLLLGAALITVKNKNDVLTPAKVLLEALSSITKKIIKVLPFGIFAITAAAAGTIQMDDFEKLQVYFLVYISSALLLSLWILPFFVSAITPFRYRDILGDCRGILVTAFATGNLFILIPVLIEGCNEIFKKHQVHTDESEHYNEIIIPVVFNFPGLGKLLALSFVLFASWFSNVDLGFGQSLGLAFNGLFSFFAKVHVSIPFLLDYLQLPADLYQLFLAGDVITKRFSSLTAAVFLISMTLTTTAFLVGLVSFNLRKIVVFLSLSVAMVFATIQLNQFIFTKILSTEQDVSVTLNHMQVDWDASSQIKYSLPGAGDPGGQPATPDQIVKRGQLRVGYNPGRVPFSYYNAQHKLVGFDVEMMNYLASSLGVELELIPFHNQDNLYKSLDNQQIDVIISGAQISAKYLDKVLYSEPTMDLTTALIVRDYRKKQFSEYDTISKMKLKLATLENYPRIGYFQRHLPNIEIIHITSLKDFFEKKHDFDALISSVEEGMTLTMLRPNYAVCFDKDNVQRFPIGYAVHKVNTRLQSLINSWLNIQRTTGRIDKLYRYWIEGQGAKKKLPRWSLLDYLRETYSPTTENPGSVPQAHK